MTVRIVTLASQKGGTGKTTLALNLGVLAETRRAPAVLIDADEHGGLSYWGLQREANQPVVVHLGDRDLTEIVRQVEDGGAAWCFIDTAAGTARKGGVIERSIELADLVILTTKPNLLDIRTARPTVDVVRATHGRGAFVINEAPIRGPTVEAAQTALAGYELPCCPRALSHRAAFAYSVLRGQAVHEYAPKDNATMEMAAVWKWLRRQINGQA